MWSSSDRAEVQAKTIARHVARGIEPVIDHDSADGHCTQILFPNPTHYEFKSAHRAISPDARWVLMNLCNLPVPAHLDHPAPGVDQPSEFHSVGDPHLHLRLQSCQPVLLGPQLDDKLGDHMAEEFLLRARQRVPAAHDIHAPSGLRIDPSGRVNPAFEPKLFPRPS